MPSKDIALSKAELLSLLLEGFLYGFSLPLFGGTIWALLSQRSTNQINRKMLAVACLLLLCSTVHVVISIARVAGDSALFEDIFPGGPDGHFAAVSHWSFVSKNYVYTVQTLIGDGVVLYRCYVVWKSKLVMILPALLWCAVVVTGIACPYVGSHATQNDVFNGSLSKWITSFWASTLATNLLTSILLAYRIWYIDRKATSSLGHRKSHLRPILYTVLDAGIIYSLTLSAALICFVNRSNSQYMILDMITPIIAITFYMVIIRVGLADRAIQPENAHPLGHMTISNVDRRMHVHVTTSIESNVDDGRGSLASPRTSMIVEKNRQSEISFANVVHVV